MNAQTWEVIIVGGGPAGLSAALILGRCRRRVLVCDDRHPRNEASAAMHGFLTRDGIRPSEFLSIAREQLKPYGIEFMDRRAVDVLHNKKIFEIILENDERVRGKKLLIATGMRDALPPVENAGKFYGKSVFHCPYCDGWENTGKPMAVYGKGKKGTTFGLTMSRWSANITVCSDGETVTDKDREALSRRGIRWREEPVLRLEGSEDGRLERVVFRQGPPLAVEVMFFNTGKAPQSRLGENLGCYAEKGGDLKTDELQKTAVPGVFVAGDAADDLKLVIIAAAEGAKAAFAINSELMDEEIA